MGFDINKLLGLSDEDTLNHDLPPVPLRDDYVPEQKPAPINPQVLASLSQKYPDAGLSRAPQSVETDDDAAPEMATPSKPSMYDEFNSKYGDDARKKALSEADDKKSGLGWLQFAAGMGDAIAGRDPSNSAKNFDSIRKGIDDKTTGIFDKNRASAVQDIANKKSFEGSDPNSEKSKVVQGIIKKNWGDKFSDEELSRVTADDAELVYKPMELKAKLDEARDARQTKLEIMKQGQQDRMSKSQGDAYQKASHDLNTFRGNSAVQQASTALTAAKNAMSLADKGNMTSADLHLFASEMGKLATGGVPGHSEIEALIPDTAKTRLAKVTSFFANSPSDTDTQAFINSNKHYLKDLLSNYQGVVDKYKADTLDGYKKKLSPEDYSDLQKRSGLGAAQPQQTSEQPDVQKYADSHGITYEQALAIKNKRTGGH